MEDRPTSQFLGKVIDVDKNGNVCIPMEFLEIAQIRAGGQVEIFANDGGVTIRTIENFCYFCNDNGAMDKILFMGEQRNICNHCKNQLRQATE